MHLRSLQIIVFIAIYAEFKKAAVKIWGAVMARASNVLLCILKTCASESWPHGPRYGPRCDAHAGRTLGALLMLGVCRGTRTAQRRTFDPAPKESLH